VSDATTPPTDPLPIRKHGVVAIILSGERFLVIRRSQSVRAPGRYCFPGGAIEPGESEEQALAREMLEELAVVARPVRRLWESVTPWQVHLAWWLTEIASDAVITPQPAEVESVHWLTAKEIRGMADVLTSNIDFLNQWESRLQFIARSSLTASVCEPAG
jgi:(d)CTP diphosphatase